MTDQITPYDMDIMRLMTGSDSKNIKSEYGYRNKFAAIFPSKQYYSLQKLSNYGYVRQVRYCKKGNFETNSHCLFRATRLGLLLLGFTDKQIERALKQ